MPDLSDRGKELDEAVAADAADFAATTRLRWRIAWGDELEDAVQSAITNILERIRRDRSLAERLRASPDTRRAFVWTTLVRVTAAQARAAAARRTLAERAGSNAPQETVQAPTNRLASAEQLAALRLLVEKAPYPSDLWIAATILLGRNTVRGLAENEGVSVRTIQRKLHLGLAQIRAAMKL